jgi:transcription initiation factor TFIID subunit 12
MADGQRNATATEDQQSTSGTSGSIAGTKPIEQVLTRDHLQEMAKEVDPNELLEDDVSEFLLTYAEEYMEKIIDGACSLAAHRKGNTLEVKDVQTYLERSSNLWIPGFGTDEVRPHQRTPAVEAHKQRLALIKKTAKKY